MTSMKALATSPFSQLDRIHYSARHIAFLAPEHPLVTLITTDEQRATVEAYVRQGEEFYRPSAYGTNQRKERRVQWRLRNKPSKWRPPSNLGRQLCRHVIRHGRHHGRARA